MSHFAELLKDKISLLLVIGAFCIFAAVVQVIDLHELKVVPRSPVGGVALCAGILIFGTGLLLIFFGDRLTTAPRVKGRWEYEVLAAEGTISHKGECFIRQNGRMINLVGKRLFTRKTDGDQTKWVRAENPWKSDWAAISHDNSIHFEVHLDLPEGNMHTFCHLHPPEGHRPQAMSGPYYLLPPFDLHILDARFGRIALTRLQGNEPVSPPNIPKVTAAGA